MALRTGCMAWLALIAAVAGCVGAGPGEQVAAGAKLVEIHAAMDFFEAPEASTVSELAP